MCSSQKQKRKKEREKLFEVANKNNKGIYLNSSNVCDDDFEQNFHISLVSIPITVNNRVLWKHISLL